VLAAAGLPTAAVALLLAVDSIPNAFRSAANSTGNMVVAAILGARFGAAVEDGPAPEREAASEPG